MHFVLCGFERDTSEDTCRLDSLSWARFAVTGRETAIEDVVERMLHASETLCRIVILVVDVDIVVFHSLESLLVEEIVIDERLGGFAGKLHHHSGRSVGIHVGIFAGNIVALDVDNLLENVSGFRLSRDAALVAIGDVALCHIFAATLHQFEFDHVLDFLNGHLRCSFESDVVGDLTNKVDVLTLVGVEHSLADCCCDFLLVETNDATIALNYGLYHT